MSYNAFISYSHAADGKLAPTLQHALHRIAKPWYKIRALHIFRDQTNLSVAPELWQSILNALSDSQYFILLASPEAAGSKWVQQEVDYWLTSKSKATLLIALTEGNIAWDSETNDFDWNLTTALPQKLKNVFTAEPFYIDLRQQKKESQLSLSDPLFLDAAATIAATLHGVSKDQLVGEDLKQHRITKWLTRSVATLLVGLSIATSLGFLTAKKQRNAALVEKFYVQAESAIQNPGDMNGDPVHAHLLAAQAYRLQPDNPTAYKALLSTLLSSHTHQNLIGHQKDIKKIAYSPDGNYLASISDEGLIVWNTHSSRVTKKFLSFLGNELSAVAFSQDGQQVVTGNKSGDLIFWEVANGNQLALIPASDTIGDEKISGMVTSISFSTDGKQLLTAHEGGMLKILNLATKEKIKIWRSHEGGLIEAHFHPINNKSILSYRIDSQGEDLYMKLWSQDNFKEVKKWKITVGSDEGITHEPTVISPNGKHILSKYLLDLMLWNTDSDENLKERLALKRGEYLLNDIGNRLFSFNFNGQQFATYKVDITSSIVNIWNFNESKTKDNAITLKAKWNDIRGLRSLVFNPSGTQIAGGGAGGNLVVWNISAGDRLSQPWLELNETGMNGFGGFAFSGDEMRFVINWDSSGAKVFDFDNNQKKFALTKEIRSNDIAVTSIALSRDGKRLLLGGNDDNGLALEIWSLTSDQQNDPPIKILAPGHTTPKHVVFSEAERKIYAVTANGRLLSWLGDSYQEIPLIGNNDDQINQAAFSPDRKVLMTTSNNHSGIRLWETTTGECYKGSTGNCRIQLGHEESNIEGIAFSPDGKLAVSASLISLWVLWDVTTGEVIARKEISDPDYEQRFGQIHFRFDNKILFHSWNHKDDNRWILWDVNPKNLIEHACEVAGRSFTTNEWTRFVGDDFLDYEERACKTNKS